MTELVVQLPDIAPPVEEVKAPQPQLCKRCGCRPERNCHKCGVDTDMCAICINEFHKCDKLKKFNDDRDISLGAIRSAVSEVIKVAHDNAMATLTKDDLDQLKQSYENQLAEKQKRIVSLLDEQKQQAAKHRDEMAELIKNFNSAQECTKDTIARLEEELKEMKMKTVDKEALKKNLETLARIPKMKNPSAVRPALTKEEGELLLQDKSTAEQSQGAPPISSDTTALVPK